MTGTVMWKKHDGEWAAYGPVDLIKAGTVTVTKKNGTTTTENVVEVAPARTVRGVTMAFGLIGTPDSAFAPPPANTCAVTFFCVRSCRDQAEHDAAEAASLARLHTENRNTCPVCEKRRATTTVRDTSGIVGRACAHCAGEPDISFH